MMPSASLDVWGEAVDILLVLLAPIAPHITEELWSRRGNDNSVHLQAWPEADQDAAADQTVTLVVQVNGKVRGKVTIAADADEESVKSAAMAEENVARFLEGKTVRKVVVVPGRLVNVVAS